MSTFSFTYIIPAEIPVAESAIVAAALRRLPTQFWASEAEDDAPTTLTPLPAPAARPAEPEPQLGHVAIALGRLPSQFYGDV